MKTHFLHFYIRGHQALAIYEYDETMRSLIYQFKGCGDLELAPIFLERFSKYLNVKYKNYKMCPAPSYYLDNETRGFNHVIEIFKYIKLPFLDIFEKIDNHKQSNQNGKQRKEIYNHIRLNHVSKIKGENLLIVDDIFTTGSTLRSLIEMVSLYKPKSIKILLLCKTNKPDIYK